MYLKCRKLQFCNFIPLYFIEYIKRKILSFQEAQKYTLVINATDHGDKVQLSSTSTVVLNIIDKNNNLPKITGHTVSNNCLHNYRKCLLSKIT